MFSVISKHRRHAGFPVVKRFMIMVGLFKIIQVFSSHPKSIMIIA